MSAAAVARRRQTLKRRRDVLLALLTGTVGSLLLGALPGLHSMLVVFVIFALLTSAYVALLVRLRNLAAERNRKLAYLPRSGPADLPRAAYAHGTIRATPSRAAQTGRRRAAGDFDRLGYGFAGNEGRYGGMTLRPVAAT